MGAKRKDHNTRMNEELRKKIKKDVASGKTKEAVSKWYEVGINNVRYASLSNSMEEYYELQRAQGGKKNRKPEGKHDDKRTEDKKTEETNGNPESKTVVVSYGMALDMAKQLHSIKEEQDIQSTSLTEILGELIEIKNILKKYMEV